MSELDAPRKGRLGNLLRAPPGRALWSAGIVLVVMLLVWQQGTRWYSAQLLSEYKAQAALRASLRGNALSLALERRFALLHGLHAYVLTEADAPDFAARFQNLAAALYTTPSAKGIRRLFAAPDSVVRYAYPAQANANTIGYAPLSDPRPQVREDTRRAIDSRQIILSLPGGSSQEALELVARKAVYVSTEDGQEEAYWGLVTIVLDLPSLLSEAELDVQTDITLDYALRDSKGSVFYGDSQVFDRDPVIHLVALPNGGWELAGAPHNGWSAQIQRPLRISQIAGLIIALLVAGLTYLSIRHQAELERAFARQTAITQENIRLHEHAQQVAVLEERQRIARELHDSVSQALYGIGLGAQTARTLLDRNPDQAAEPLAYILTLAEAGLAEMRALVFELRPDSLQREGLVSALRKQAAALRARHGLEVHEFLVQEPEASLEVKETLYRIAQEAINNVVKHAQAGRVEIRLESQPQALALMVRDDGAGFDPQAAHPGHLGLHSMRERAQKLGGALHIDSAPGNGTEVHARIPLKPLLPSDRAA